MKKRIIWNFDFRMLKKKKKNRKSISTKLKVILQSILSDNFFLYQTIFILFICRPFDVFYIIIFIHWRSNITFKLILINQIEWIIQIWSYRLFLPVWSFVDYFYLITNVLSNTFTSFRNNKNIEELKNQISNTFTWWSRNFWRCI